MLLKKRRKSGRVEEGNIATDDNDIPIEVGRQGINGNLDGATGARNVILINDQNVGHEFGERCHHFVTLMTHDRDDVVGVELARGGNDVPNELTASKAVKHLGLGRLHASALACCENNDGECVFGHSSILP